MVDVNGKVIPIHGQCLEIDYWYEDDDHDHDSHGDDCHDGYCDDDDDCNDDFHDDDCHVDGVDDDDDWWYSFHIHLTIFWNLDDHNDHDNYWNEDSLLIQL